MVLSLEIVAGEIGLSRKVNRFPSGPICLPFWVSRLTNCQGVGEGNALHVPAWQLTPLAGDAKLLEELCNSGL